jgi:arsenite-transporting ATPase
MSNIILFSQMLENAPRNLFFTGKGGVGKTSLACATAVALADKGHNVLLVSTDPASNLDAVLETKLSAEPTPITSVPGLMALNIDPEEAARNFRERMVGPYRGVLPVSAVARMEEQLSGACTMEIAAFDEFSKMLGNPDFAVTYDYVIFDTAPTGHTLRLLQLPKAWDGFLKTNSGDFSCVGPLAGLQQKRELYAAAVAALTDPRLTTVVLVSRPELSALKEADRTRSELDALGISQLQLLINGVYPHENPSDLLAQALVIRSREALSSMPQPLTTLPQVRISLLPLNIVGISALRALYKGSVKEFGKIHGEQPEPKNKLELPALSSIIDKIAGQGPGVVMVMGKGGVGKTTLAAAIAVELVLRGLPVHLTTTDPAAHVQGAVGSAVKGLTVSRIDPREETENYRREILESAGQELDPEGLALLEEDLRSPCTEEIAVFRAFARIVAGGQDGFIILDTAPTGHTLLLLDTTETYQREVARNASRLPDEIVALLTRLRDPRYTRILIATLPEPTPVEEAIFLQNDLKRAGISPFAWIINQSLSLTETQDPLLQARRENEAPYIERVKEISSGYVALVPWMNEVPTGADKLQQLVHSLPGPVPQAPR